MTEENSFSNLKLIDALMKSINELGFSTPTEIQKKSIPILLKTTKDFVGQAQTGTGKTIAFAIPLLQKLDYTNTNVQALILTPTRELAQQVESEIVKLAKYLDLKSLCVYGGTPYEAQIRDMRKVKPQVVVGTPGRVIDLIKKGVLHLNKANFLILDEADEMLNMGFFEDVELIMTKFKQKRQLLMFSATMPKPIVKLINNSFNEPTVVKIETQSISNDDIEQKYFIVREKHFKEALSRLIDSASAKVYAIVFCRTKIETREVGDDLKKRGHDVEVLNGDMGQPERDLAMNNFKKKRATILVCTDVAARGIDINNLTHVFNYGLPRDNESYVHRIGRTGRAGMKGVAYTIVGPKATFDIENLERHIKKRISLEKLPSVEVLKENLVLSEIEAAEQILSAIQSKGDEFKTEDSYKFFEEKFKDLDHDQFMKLMFVWKFNKEIRRYNNLSDIETINTSSSSSRKDRKKPGRSERRPGTKNKKSSSRKRY
ncbi:DEAD/DEAH box helicase [Halobacteriovorax sp. HLS]|uniref:DEAD/DEAH box helicase n=1 Tax=Halobacteriovorax sp. HLS TaxID=2234000 RepID=UPI000FDA8615|nr:DEAD/DEAH box helicase [Halobacteriovorax sp. HLS]